MQKLSATDPQKAAVEARRIADLISERLNQQLGTVLLKSFQEGLKRAASEGGIATPFSPPLADRVRLLQNTPALTQATNDLLRDLQTRAGEAFVASMTQENGFSLKAYRTALRDVAGFARARVQTIARTESNRFFQSGRREAYKAAEAQAQKPFLYSWAGPSDYRTTTCCQDIKRDLEERKGGVPWDELVGIVKNRSRESFPEFIVDNDAPTAHWNCRHFALRAFPNKYK